MQVACLPLWQEPQGVTFANGYASFNGTASDVRTVNRLDLPAHDLFPDHEALIH